MNGGAAEKKHCTAVILAGGSGTRMKSNIAKQFMLLRGKPLLWYSLEAIQRSELIDDCILVAGKAGDGADGAASEISDFVRREIVEKYGFTKVTAMVPGGTERCWSVENAMAFLRDRNGSGEIPDRTDYVFIHDSARPFLTEDILRRTYEGVERYRACVAAMPSKDTVKLASGDGFAVSTPDRSSVWTIQTPQVFERELITEAYRQLRELYFDKPGAVPVTDDAGVVEMFTQVRVKLVEGSYQNIKITTPEDVKMAEAFLD